MNHSHQKFTNRDAVMPFITLKDRRLLCNFFLGLLTSAKPWRSRKLRSSSSSRCLPEVHPIHVFRLQQNKEEQNHTTNKTSQKAFNSNKNVSNTMLPNSTLHRPLFTPLHAPLRRFGFLARFQRRRLRQGWRRLEGYVRQGPHGLDIS